MFQLSFAAIVPSAYKDCAHGMVSKNEVLATCVC